MVYLEYINYRVLVVRYRLSSCSDSMREGKVLILEHTFKRFYEEEGEFEILTLASWFSHYSYSRTSIRSSMGGWLGKYSMLSKVLRSKKKEKNRKMKKREKKRKMKEKKRRIKCSLALLASLIFQVTLKNYSILKSSNHVQSDNENFICVSGSSICHLHMSTYLNVCVSSFSLSNIIFQWPFWLVSVNPIDLSLSLTIFQI